MRSISWRVALAVSVFLLACISANAQSTITVTSPNGGGSWQMGTTQNVTWNGVGVTGNVTITLLKAGAGYFAVGTAPASQGTFSWKVPNGLAVASDYTIRVMSATDSTIRDVSDATFSITAPAASITVLGPNGGESWPMNTTHTITWNAPGVAGNVNIAVLKAGVGYFAVANGVPASQGTFSWKVPVGLAVASDYTMRVMSATDSSIIDVSNATFSITPAPVTVVSPNGGESWAMGTTHSVTWITSGVTGNVNITLMKAGVGYFAVATGVPATQGSFSWTIPSGLAVASDYTMRVMSATDNTQIDVSNTTFSLTAPLGSVTVVSPNGLETWAIGSTQNITWTSSGLTGNVNIALLKAGVGYYSIATGVPVSAGSFSWIVPNGLALGSDYTVRVMSATDGTIKDVSNANFSIITASTLSVVSPNGGESWALGSTQSVQWNAVNVTKNLNITLLKAGVGYFAIATNIPPSPGAFSWAIPSALPAASDYTVRVMTTDGTLVAKSNTTFSLTAVAPVITTHPLNQIVNSGQTASFSVAATGTAPLSYQWKKNTIAIPGATNSSYTTPATTLADNGASFTVTVSNTAGSVTSNAATLTVNSPVVSPVITVQPQSQSVTEGQNASFGVTATGTAPLTYQWKKNTVVIPGATGSTYITPPTTLADNGASFTVTVSNSAGSAASAPATLTVNPATFQVSGNIGLTNSGPSFQGLAGVTVAINTVPPQTTATDISGNFNFNGVPNGTYTVTPSLPGVSSVFYPTTQTVNVNGGNANTNFMAAVGYTLSGTVNYAGTKTGRIYLSLGGTGLPLGTSIAGPGPFTIRGVPPGNYVLFAWMDNVGQGVQNSSNPTGNVLNIPVSTINVSGTVLTLTDATVPSIATQAPGISNIAGADGAAIVFVNPIWDVAQTEIPTSYTVDWSTTSDFTVHTSKTFPAIGGDQPYIVTGLTNGTPLFFRVRGQANDTSNWSTPSAAVPIGPTTGANQVSGSVTFGGTATGPMYVGFYDNATGAIYSSKIASPVSPQAYVVNGVPNGTNYFNFVIIDQNNNGLIDAGDLSNTGHNNATVAVNGPTSGQNILLSNANSIAVLNTDHMQMQTDTYTLSFNVNGNVKRVVAAALTNGPNVLSPMDAALNSGKGGGQLNFWQGTNTTRPSVGDTYSVSVTYSDNTSETLHPIVTGVSDAFVSNQSPTGSIASTTPTFTWTDPVNAASYAYSFSLWDSNNNNIWQIPNNGGALTSATTSITWGVDPLGTGNLPSVGSLTPGANYSWGVWVADAQGNTASKQVGFSVSGTPVAPTIAVQPQNQSVIVGQPATFSVTASGTPAPSYQWYKNGVPIAGAISNFYTTPPTLLSDSGAVFMVFVSNSAGSLFSNTAVLTVNPVATITVSGNINRVNCGPSCPIAGINVSINTVPPQSANTDVNGNYSFSAIPNGNYNVTPSITGVSSAFFPPVQGVSVNGASVQANFMADIAYTVSGTVNYTGAKTGRIYITVSGGNAGFLLGTSIASPGAFSIRGVEPSQGFYSLHAWMDTRGRGIANAENPVGDALNVSVNNSDTGGVVITLSDPVVPSLITQSPSIATLSATDGTAIVFVNSISNGAGVEIPTSYTVQWSDTSDFSTNVGSAVFPAIGGRDPFIVTGLPNATLLYFRVQGLATTTSLWSNAWGPTLINPLIGSNVISGSVTFPGTATGPMYVGFFDQRTNIMYMGRVPSPISPQSYTVQGVPNGNYQFFAIIDQNNNGLLDAGDIENTEVNAPPVTINGPSSTMNLTLASGNSLAMMTTNHGQNIGQAFDNYSLNYRLIRGLKMPVALTSVSGSGAVVPMDIGFDGTKAGRVDFWQGINGMRPTVGANYGLVVTYSDGTSEPVSAQVTGVSDAFISTMSPQGVVPGNTTPTFTWTDPVNPTNYLYNFNLWDTTGPNWQTLWTLPKKQQGFSSAFTSITWNVDPTGGGSHPSVSTLTSGHSYTWSVTTMDAQGNTASLNAGFNP